MPVKGIKQSVHFLKIETFYCQIIDLSSPREVIACQKILGYPNRTTIKGKQSGIHFTLLFREQVKFCLIFFFYEKCYRRITLRAKEISKDLGLQCVKPVLNV